jgi:hypothetical protein
MRRRPRASRKAHAASDPLPDEIDHLGAGGIPPDELQEAVRSGVNTLKAVIEAMAVSR